jgi:transaldolase
VTGAKLSLAAFTHTLADSDVYLAQVRDLALREASADAALRALIVYDARWACDVLQEVYARSSGVDGRLSVVLPPRCAQDTDRAIAEARALWWQVDRPNLLVGITATAQGLPAITTCLAEGIGVTATRIGSRVRYADVVGAFLDGLERARQAGRDLAATSATPLLWMPPEGDVPEDVEAQEIEDDEIAMFNTALYQVQVELGRVSHDTRTTP